MTRNAITPRKTLFVVYLGGFLVLALQSFLSLPILKTGAPRWIIGNTLVLFTGAFIPLHTAALLFGYSLYFKTGELFQESGRHQAFLATVKSASISFIVLTAFYMALLEGILPAGVRIRDEVTRRNAEASHLLAQARSALEEKRYTDAVALLERYNGILPDDPEVKKDREAAVAGSAAQTGRTVRDGDVHPDLPPQGMAFQDFLARAEELFAREDYIGAEHNAAMALKLDDRHPGPKRILAASREKISRASPGRRERENIEFFRQKRVGHDLLERGDYITAFYHLQKLQADRPDDPEVLHYLEEAYRGTRKISFFLDEVPWEPHAGVDETLLFLNRRDAEGWEFISIRRFLPSFGGETRYEKPEPDVVLRHQEGEGNILSRLGRFFRSSGSPSSSPGTPTGHFALDIEGIKISSGGEKIFHFKAPYGKFIEDSLVMRCLDRGRRNASFEPAYLLGEAPDSSPSLIRLGPSPEDLSVLSAGLSRARSLNGAELLTVSKTFSRLGWDPFPVFRLFFDRLLLPFSFLTLSFTATAFGLRLRSRYLGRPPAAAFLFLPILPFLTGLVFEVYRYVCSPFPAAVLAVYGFPAATAVFFVQQGLLLLLSLILMAREVRG